MTVLSAERRDLAVFTIAQDEPEFVHAWVNHYKKHVAAPSDVHVLLHAPTGPDGGSIGDSEISAWRHAEALLGSHHGVTTLHVHRVLAFDHMWLEETAARFQAFLLQSYDWVLFAEIDEFILPRPNGPAATLLEFVRALGRDAPAAIRAEGFEVMQQPGEPPLSRQLYEGGTNTALTAADLLEGRSFWHVSDVLSKTLVARVPMRWEVGFHRVREGAAEISRRFRRSP